MNAAVPARPRRSPIVRTASLYVCAAVLVAWTAWWAGSGRVLADFGGDNAVYFLTANHLSPWGERHAAAAEFAARSVFPPLYPAVLAVAGGGTSLAAAHRVTAVIIVAAGVAAWWWLRAVGLSRPLALAALGLLAASRAVLLQGLELHSEHLYLALWLSACAMAAYRTRSAHLALACACAIIATYVTRSAGVALVASFAIWLVLVRPPRAMRAGLLCVAALVALHFTHAGNARYAANMLMLYEQGGVVDRLVINAHALWPAWLSAFGVAGQPGFSALFPGVIAALAAVGLWLRLRAKHLDAWTCAGYAALLVVWPYPAEYARMIYPLLPFALGFAWSAAHAWSRLWLASALPLVLWLAAILPFAALVHSRLATPPADPAFTPYLRSSAWFELDPAVALPTLGYQRALTEALREIGRPGRLPLGACVHSIKSSVVAALSGRIARPYPPFSIAAETTRAALAASRCRYLFMMLTSSPSYPQHYYPYALLEPWLEVIAVYPNPLTPRRPAALLARLRPPPPARH